MFAQRRNPALAYAKVGLETGVASADPVKLILMLFDGALLAISSATQHMEHEEVASKGKAIAHAISIIDGGLKASLDVKAGGDLAEQLDALYEYMCSRLAYANLKNSKPALDEVSQLLGELKGAWEEIAKKPVAHSQNQVAA
jgi:flagellar protein FliS